MPTADTHAEGDIQISILAETGGFRSWGSAVAAQQLLKMESA